MHRFTDTKKWEEDWYCDLKGEYQKLWDYVCDHCDNAGIWKPNRIDFEIKTGFKVSLDSFLKKVNGDKLRIAALENGRWFIPGFIQYQWFTKQQSFNLVLTNPRHKHIYEILLANDIELKKVRGLKEVWKTSKAVAMDELPSGVLEGGTGETLEPVIDEPFTINPECPLPPSTLLAAEQNQFALTKNKNTDFIQDQWGVFLLERIHDPPERRRQFRQLSDLTTYFLNWVRNKHPNATNQRTTTGGTSAKPGTSEARIKRAKEW